MSIAICGGGASGLAVLTSILAEHTLRGAIQRIYLYEKRPEVGPGMAYSEDSGNSIVNMAADTMSLVDGDPLHFSRWLAHTHPALAGVRFPPRRIYGVYLKELFRSQETIALSLDICLERLSQAVGISVTGKQFIIRDEHGETQSMDKVVIAVGNFPAKTQSHLARHAHYFCNPWPLAQLDTIPRTSRVCIVGTRLSAIDTLFHLLDNDHIGPIYMASRGGLLPGVQAFVSDKYRGAYALALLAKDLESAPKPTTLAFLASKISTLGDNYGGCGWGDASSAMTEQQALFQNIQEAEEGGPSWRKLANSASNVLERFWNCLPTHEKKLFMSHWNSLWYARIHAMPIENAHRLQRALTNGQVELLKLGDLKKDQLGFSECHPDRQNSFDYIIEASGISTDVVESQLGRSMLSSELIEQCELGGCSVDQYTLESKKTPGLYVIGSLTTGVHFYTNGIDRVVEHATRIARHLGGKRTRCPRHVALIVPHLPHSRSRFLTRLLPAILEKQLLPFLYIVGHNEWATRAKPKSTDEDGTIQQVEHSTLEELGCQFGIFVGHWKSFDASCMVDLINHFVDFGFIFDRMERYDFVEPAFRVTKVVSKSELYLMTKTQQKDGGSGRNAGLESDDEAKEGELHDNEEDVDTVLRIISLLESK